MLEIVAFLLGLSSILILSLKKYYHYTLLKKNKGQTNDNYFKFRFLDFDRIKSFLPIPVFSQELRRKYSNDVRKINILILISYILIISVFVLGLLNRSYSNVPDIPLNRLEY